MELALSRCVSCRGFLTQVFLVEVRGRPHSAPGHQLVYGHAILAQCRSCSSGQLEKVSHDCFDPLDGWDQYGWHVLTPEDMGELGRELKTCKWPLGPSCECEVHRSIRISSERLTVPQWVGAVLPEWSDQTRVMRNVNRVMLVRTNQGLPVLVSADESR